MTARQEIEALEREIDALRRDREALDARAKRHEAHWAPARRRRRVVLIAALVLGLYPWVRGWHDHPVKEPEYPSMRRAPDDYKCAHSIAQACHRLALAGIDMDRNQRRACLLGHIPACAELLPRLSREEHDLLLDHLRAGVRRVP